MNLEQGALTRLLADASEGHQEAQDELFRCVYTELYRRAHSACRNGVPIGRIEPTALVNEMYLKLFGKQGEITWNDRGHFFAVASEAMRHILVDQARRRHAAKRGGGIRHIPFEDDEVPDIDEQASEAIALDEGLAKLEEISEEAALIAKIRLFSGLTHEEIAKSTGLAEVRVRRRWKFAKAWLRDWFLSESD